MGPHLPLTGGALLPPLWVRCTVLRAGHNIISLLLIGDVGFVMLEGASEILTPWVSSAGHPPRRRSGGVFAGPITAPVSPVELESLLS